MKTLSVATFSQVFYFVTFLITSGMFLGTRPSLSKFKYTNESVFWTLSLLSLTLAFLSFALTPVLGNVFLTAGNVLAVTSSILLAAFIRSWRCPITKTYVLCMVGAILLFVIVFQMLLMQNDYDSRVHLAATYNVIASLLALYELRSFIKGSFKDPSFHLRILVIALVFRMIVLVWRAIEASSASSDVSTIFNEEVFTTILRFVTISSNILVFVCVNNYLYEVVWNKAVMRANAIESTMQASFNAIIRVMNHELNQPLGAIKLDASYGKHMVNHAGDSEQPYEGIFSRIEKSIDRASSLLGRLTRQSRFNQPNLIQVDLRGILRDAVVLLTPYFKRHSTTFKLDICEKPVLINADELQISQVLVNIIKNAIEATPHKQVTITCRINEGNAVVTVQDEGMGFSDEALANLGEKFFTTKTDGVGLGVAISQELAALHHGHLRFENLQPTGALVELQLPLAERDN